MLGIFLEINLSWFASNLIEGLKKSLQFANFLSTDFFSFCPCSTLLLPCFALFFPLASFTRQYCSHIHSNEWMLEIVQCTGGCRHNKIREKRSQPHIQGLGEYTEEGGKHRGQQWQTFTFWFQPTCFWEARYLIHLRGTTLSIKIQIWFWYQNGLKSCGYENPSSTSWCINSRFVTNCLDSYYFTYSTEHNAGTFLWCNICHIEKNKYPGHAVFKLTHSGILFNIKQNRQWCQWLLYKMENKIPLVATIVSYFITTEISCWNSE